VIGIKHAAEYCDQHHIREIGAADCGANIAKLPPD
jgi:hypothetical protein